MSARYNINREIEGLKILIKNPFIDSKDKMNAIYDGICKIEDEVHKW